MFVLVRGRKRELFHVTCKGGRGIASRERERERKNRFLQRCAVLCSVLCREISALLDHHDPIITFSVASSCFLLLVTETKGGNCTFLRLSFPWEVRDSIAEGLETLPKEWNELPSLLFPSCFCAQSWFVSILCGWSYSPFFRPCPSLRREGSTFIHKIGRQQRWKERGGCKKRERRDAASSAFTHTVFSAREGRWDPIEEVSWQAGRQISMVFLLILLLFECGCTEETWLGTERRELIDFFSASFFPFASKRRRTNLREESTSYPPLAN